ncbi:DUF1249 domain-containing protein [Alteromonas oceanisediminis]|uniref:DUF1249 domain-containing protein n=1 Tax=Alteromonas oceanisediminis TaxID=2836180 RepID=UPI001BDAFE55|nr:DUF1249 domain-containing protein [Alteromonas oceanisediminis]MBT0585355.1 DUF1249 domain-containing protein [Alteromonas oceanisediminis]
MLNKRKYVPHLPSILAVCEANYAKLMRLLPDVDTERLEYVFSAGEKLRFRIRILDSARFTSTLEMRQVQSNSPAFLQPAMEVRLYHDANVAEVLTSQRVGALDPSYEYPNRGMHQRNEKQMVNRFLAEWLTFCLSHRQASVSGA